MKDRRAIWRKNCLVRICMVGKDVRDGRRSRTTVTSASVPQFVNYSFPINPGLFAFLMIGFERAEVGVVRRDATVFHKSRPPADRHSFFRDQTPDLGARMPWAGIRLWIGERHLQHQPISAW